MCNHLHYIKLTGNSGPLPKTKFQLFLFSLILSLLFLQAAQAEEDFWEYLNGPPFGEVFDMVINGNGNMFISSYNGIFRSTDEGNSWMPSKVPCYVYTMTAGNKNVYAAIGDNVSDFICLVYTKDDGLNWDTIPPPWESAWNGKSYHSLRLAVDTNASLYMLNDSNHTKIIAYYNDSGKTWEKKVINFEGMTDFKIKKFRIEKNGEFFVSGYDNRGYEVNPGYIWYSEDSGETWTSTDSIPGGCYGYIRFGDDTIYTVGYYGLFISFDKGKKWQATDNKQYIYLISKDNENGIYMIDYSTEKPTNLLYSSDKGYSWEIRELDNHVGGPESLNTQIREKNEYLKN